MLHGISVDGIDMGTGAGAAGAGGTGGAGGAGGMGGAGGTGGTAGAAPTCFSQAWRDFRYSEYDIGCSQHLRDAVRREEELA